MSLDDDFGAGLDFGTDTRDPFMDEFRTLVDGLPEDATRESVADYIDRMTKDAERAKELEAQLLEIQQRQLTSPSAPAAGAGASAAEAAAAAAAEEKRRFEIAQVDAHLLPFLQGGFATLDSSGYYVPGEQYKLNPQVLQACQAKNAQLQRQQEFTTALLENPYDTIDEGVRHSPTVRKMMEEFAAFKKQFDERLQPIQKQTEQSAEDAFIRQNAAVLLTADGSDWTPAGKAYFRAREKNIAPADALELIQPFIEAQQAAAAAAAAAAAPKPAAKPPRVIDRIVTRMKTDGSRPSERGAPAFETRRTGIRGRLSDLDAVFLGQDDN